MCKSDRGNRMMQPRGRRWVVVVIPVPTTRPGAYDSHELGGRGRAAKISKSDSSTDTTGADSRFSNALGDDQ